jgi:hypothetical protein
MRAPKIIRPANTPLSDLNGKKVVNQDGMIGVIEYTNEVYSSFPIYVTFVDDNSNEIYTPYTASGYEHLEDDSKFITLVEFLESPVEDTTVSAPTNISTDQLESLVNKVMEKCNINRIDALEFILG